MDSDPQQEEPGEPLPAAVTVPDLASLREALDGTRIALSAALAAAQSLTPPPPPRRRLRRRPG